MCILNQVHNQAPVAGAMGGGGVAPLAMMGGDGAGNGGQGLPAAVVYPELLGADGVMNGGNQSAGAAAGGSCRPSIGTQSPISFLHKRPGRVVIWSLRERAWWQPVGNLF